MKILVISLAGIGDTLFATPLIHELRLNFPTAKIDAFVRWDGAKFLENNPHLNSVYQKDLLAVSKREAFAFLMKLRREKYDLSLNTFPQSKRQYRIVAKFINARTRVSHEYESSGMLDHLLVNRSIAQDYSCHAVENNLRLLSLLEGRKPQLNQHGYEIFLTAAEQQWADGFISEHQLENHHKLGIHVGSGGTKNLSLRRWPVENYIELCRGLRNNHPETKILFFGGPEEIAAHERILSALGGSGLYFPKTQGIRHAAALIGKCDLFLSVDTSLMHLAAAMKVQNQIVIETPTWNKPIEPYGNPFQLVKNPAVAGRNLQFYRYDGRGIQGSVDELVHCMKSVSVESVAMAISDALGKSV